MQTFENKTAIVTGGAKGIGRATATALAAAGANVVVADIDRDAAEQAAASIAEAGGRVVAVAADVSREDTFEMLRDTALDQFGGVDIVMNNVGVLTRGLPENIPVKEWQRILDINFLSVVRSNVVFLPILLEQRSGHIVNTASVAGLFPYAYDRTPYAATKAAIIGLSENLALYLRPHNVGITVLCPGPVLTNIFDSVRLFGPDTPLNSPGEQFRLLDPAEVADMVLDAIRTDRFMLPTHAAVRDILIERASDWDGFLAKQIERTTQP
ncbi:MAG: SDR family oxidoreductase [Mycobacterium sp.]